MSSTAAGSVLTSLRGQPPPHLALDEDGQELPDGRRGEVGARLCQVHPQALLQLGVAVRLGQQARLQPPELVVDRRAARPRRRPVRGRRNLASGRRDVTGRPVSSTVLQTLASSKCRRGPVGTSSPARDDSAPDRADPVSRRPPRTGRPRRRAGSRRGTRRTGAGPPSPRRARTSVDHLVGQVLRGVHDAPRRAGRTPGAAARSTVPVPPRRHSRLRRSASQHSAHSAPVPWTTKLRVNRPQARRSAVPVLPRPAVVGRLAELDGALRPGTRRARGTAAEQRVHDLARAPPRGRPPPPAPMARG